VCLSEWKEASAIHNFRKSLSVYTLSFWRSTPASTASPADKSSGRACQRLPIEARVTLRGTPLPVSRNGERTLPAAWRTAHGAENGGGHRTYPAGRDEAREVFHRAGLGSRVQAKRAHL